VTRAARAARALLLLLGALCGAARAAAAPAASCEIAHASRVVAVGDVHGAYDRLLEILKTAGVVDARGRWSGGDTHLVQLGDVLDRGPDSRKALDLLRRLEKEAARAGGAVHVLLGNHEVMRMIGDLRYVAPGEYAAFVTPDSEETRERLLQSFEPAARERLRKETPLGLVEMSQAFAAEGEYGKWLRGLPAVVKIDGVLFLHGGISPAVAELRCGEINVRVRQEITGGIAETRKAPLESLAGREDGPLWYRGLAQQPEDFAPEVLAILQKQDARAIVVAHTVTPESRIVVRFGGRVIEIDTGMQPAYVPSGRASALELKDGKFTAIYQDRREPLPDPARD
jgi:diadenosine tetraphosphatase ApaH/serine/threonine PP2A family protein phosphatase